MSATDDLLAEYFVHAATVETYLGTNGLGVETYAAPFTLDPATNGGCFIEGQRHLVTGADGETVTSGSTLYCHPDHAGRFEPRSRVTIAYPSRTVETRVVTLNINDLTDEFPQHVAVSLE
jgi:hypothetical protein